MYRYVGGHFRRRRRDWVADEFHGCHSVVDLGGTVESWIGERFPNITVVNVKPSKGDLPTGFSYLQADACDSQLPGGFDLAFSNSAIEHVGTLDRQRQFADEMRRLGRRLCCQTPNRWFPVEPHYLGLFVHWLPPSFFGHFLHRWLTVQGLAGRPSVAESRTIRQGEAIRFLTRRELRELFPGCQLRTERFLGWPKSFIVWR